MTELAHMRGMAWRELLYHPNIKTLMSRLALILSGKLFFSDRAEMKYCNWLLDNGFKPEGGCMVAEMTDYLWKQENCTEYKRFICQTGIPVSAYIDVETHALVHNYVR